MDILAASSIYTTANNDNIKHNNKETVKPQPTNRNITVHRFLKDQIIIAVLAGILSYALYFHGPASPTEIQKFVQDLMTPVVSYSPDQYQLLLDEIEQLRADLAAVSKTTVAFDNARESDPVYDAIDGDEESEDNDANEDSIFPLGIADFSSIFGITPYDDIEYRADFEEYFQDYELTSDPFYLENRELLDAAFDEYAQFMTTSSLFDPRYFVEWSSVSADPALFAKQDIPAGAFLGTFAGVISDEAKDMEKAWRYKASLFDENEEPVELLIDGSEYGNWFQFLQIRDGDGNAEAFFIPYNNMIYVAFKATRDISAFEEIYLDSGNLE